MLYLPVVIFTDRPGRCYIPVNVHLNVNVIPSPPQSSSDKGFGDVYVHVQVHGGK